MRNNPDDYHFMFEHETCPVCKSQDVYTRILAEQDKQWDEQHKTATPQTARPSDGRRVGLRPAAPDEIERAQRTRSREEG